MLVKIGRLGIVVVLALAILLGIVLVASSYSEVGLVSEVGADGLALSTYEPSVIPEPVVEDATELATELFGDCPEKCDNFVSQLLAIYLEAKDKDFVIVFNPGGWGWNLLEDAPGWRSISTGIQSELNFMGYESLMLEYKRTSVSWRGLLEELMEAINLYPEKAKDLACRLQFLTSQIPDLKVILAGESMGTIFTDQVMVILEDNPQVYSIQTGPPFWHENMMLDRTLVMANNGIVPDSFSHGDFPTIIFSNLKSLFGFSRLRDDFGTILNYVGAPGHDYWWQYPKVYSEITIFLEQNFSVKW